LFNNDNGQMQLLINAAVKEQWCI